MLTIGQAHHREYTAPPHPPPPHHHHPKIVTHGNLAFETMKDELCDFISKSITTYSKIVFYFASSFSRTSVKYGNADKFGSQYE